MTEAPALALVRAGGEKKPLFIDFGASWRPACIKKYHVVGLPTVILIDSAGTEGAR